MRSLIILLTAAFFGATAVAGIVPHLLYGKRIAGQVVDGETGKPIAGAHVAFLWESTIVPKGFTGHNSRDICYHAAATLTDGSGRFEIPEWQKWSTYDVINGDPVGAIYVPHYTPYAALLRQGQAAPSEHLNEHYRLNVSSGPSEQRIHLLFWGLANRDCLYGGESQKSLYPMLKAIHGEAKELARTRADEQIVSSIARIAAETALAQDPTKPWDEERTKAFIEENLK